MEAPAAPTPQDPPTEDDVLAAYWGDRWPEIRAALVAEGRDLSAPLELVPWEEQAEAIYERIFHFSDADKAEWKDRLLRWPPELTSQWLSEHELLAQGVELTPVQLQELSDRAGSWNVDINWKIDDYLVLLAAEHERRWQTGEFQRAPCSTAGLPQPEDAFFGSSAACGSWTALVSLSRAENPDLAARSEEIFGLVRQRNGEIKSLIKAQRER